RGQQEDPHDAAVLQEDRVRRRGPLGREHEGRQAGGVARDADQEGRRPPPQARPEDGEERHRRGRRAVERDLERRLGEELDADPAGRPEQRRRRDEQDARALGARRLHGRTASTMARDTTCAAAAPTRSRVSGGGGGPPGARANATSPSTTVCAGRIARARPSCASIATRLRLPESNGTVVATQTSVVFAPARGESIRTSSRSARSARNRPPDPGSPYPRRPPRIPPASASTTSPTALTAASAATIAPSGSRCEATPIPPGDAFAAPRSFPAVAPVPAPTRPRSGAASVAASHARRPIASSGNARGSPPARSKRTAAATIGTRAGPTGNPAPRS